MSDFKRAPISGLAAALVRATVSRLPVDMHAYDNLAASVVEETMARILPNEPLSLVDIADRVGILPPKRKGGRRGLR